ncbi:hypothetical protein CY35_01G002400 [Sphagnum magellanicum]|nr:hypothetical protein CY35_01G002400 [Sphagnum magellanicum]
MEALLPTLIVRNKILATRLAKHNFGHLNSKSKIPKSKFQILQFQNQNSKFCNSKIKNKKSLFLAIGSKCVSIDK